MTCRLALAVPTSYLAVDDKGDLSSPLNPTAAATTNFGSEAAGDSSTTHS